MQMKGTTDVPYQQYLPLEGDRAPAAFIDFSNKISIAACINTSFLYPILEEIE